MIPLRALGLFCRVVESTRPVEVLAASLGLVLAGPREQALMRLGEAAVEAKRVSAKRRRALEALQPHIEDMGEAIKERYAEAA